MTLDAAMALACGPIQAALETAHDQDWCVSHAVHLATKAAATVIQQAFAERDGVDVGALQALLALSPAITLQQAVDEGVDEALGWDPYALKEGADPHSPAMASWKVEAARKSLDALK